MEVPVIELVRDLVREVKVGAANGEGDASLQGLIDDFQSSAAVVKRDLRRILEKDPAAFLRSACRVLKSSSQSPGALWVMELLWSNPVLVGSLSEPELLPLDTAIAFAKRWAEYDPMLDIKLLHLGFPSDGTAELDGDIMRAKRVLAIVSELPASRHILVPLVNLMRSPDPKVRSKAASLYGRTSQNPDWVRKRLGEMDERVRANALEGLWGMDSRSARAVLEEAVCDPHHRVAANALIGLHRIGGQDVTANLQRMAHGPEAMSRAAAAFAMGQILNADFKPVLESLLKDTSPHVRSQALRSLIRLKRQQQPGAKTLPDGDLEAAGHRAPEQADDTAREGPADEAAEATPAPIAEVSSTSAAEVSSASAAEVSSTSADKEVQE